VWRALPADRQRPWLTRAWVRKEAALKAVGSGLRIPPRTIDVGGGDGEGSAWEIQLDDRTWHGFDVFDAVPEGYRAAVVIAAVSKPWFVYVIRCAGDRLYCGIATDVAARFDAHRSGRGAKFTRAFAPEALLATRRTATRSEALREEAAFKALTRLQKLARIDAWERSAG
jgi:putative endonuclease